QTEAFLRVFVERIDRAEQWLLALRSRYRQQDGAVLVLELPAIAAQLLLRALLRCNNSAVRAPCSTLAINAHGRGAHEPLYGRTQQAFEQHCGAEIVDRRVGGNLVHAL